MPASKSKPKAFKGVMPDMGGDPKDYMRAWIVKEAKAAKKKAAPKKSKRSNTRKKVNKANRKKKAKKMKK